MEVLLVIKMKDGSTKSKLVDSTKVLKWKLIWML